MISVIEFQKDNDFYGRRKKYGGAVHFHCLVWGLDDKGLDQEATSRDLQRMWLRGFCDSTPTDGSPKLAGYLSKYLSKAMFDTRLGGQKAYSVTRNVLRPVSQAGTADFEADELRIAGVDLENPILERVFDTQYLGKCTYYALNCEELTEQKTSNIVDEWTL